MANYAVHPEVLEKYVPDGTVIDEFEGKVFVSLVAFMFNDTRVLGLRVPYHVSFEEVNLRFYVTPHKDRTRRAVTFIKEIVPRRVIPLIANTLFDENYVALPMSHDNSPMAHSYSWIEGQQNTFSGRLSADVAIPQPGSIGEFITEHYWCYTRGRKKTLEYQVEHPQWRACELDDYNISVNFEKSYGANFSFLQNATPYNVLYAEGSEVNVRFPRRYYSKHEN
jgi:uncharacterized protein YqjF (DUF2071 family)